MLKPLPGPMAKALKPYGVGVGHMSLKVQYMLGAIGEYLSGMQRAILKLTLASYRKHAMTTAEAIRICRRHGWSVYVRTKGNHQYIQARRWDSTKKRHITKYVYAVNRLLYVEASDILVKLGEQTAA